MKLALHKNNKKKYASLYGLGQWCQKCGLRAKCGPRRRQVRPAKDPKISIRMRPGSLGSATCGPHYIGACCGPRPFIYWAATAVLRPVAGKFSISIPPPVVSFARKVILSVWGLPNLDLPLPPVKHDWSTLMMRRATLQTSQKVAYRQKRFDSIHWSRLTLLNNVRNVTSSFSVKGLILKLVPF